MRLKNLEKYLENKNRWQNVEDSDVWDFSWVDFDLYFSLH